MRHRPYRDEGDLLRIHALLRRVYAIQGPRVRMTVGDLEYWRFQEADPSNALATAELFFDGDELVAFAWPNDKVLDFAVHPQHAGRLRDILDWGARDEVPVLDCEVELQRLLRARGYAPTEERMDWYRVRPVAAPIPEPTCEVRSGPDPNLIAPLHTGRPISLAAYRQLATSPIYRRDLDLFVPGPDGRPTAFALVWFDEANRVGLFEPVGCLPAYRRQRRASSLIAEGVRRLRALGALHALVACRVGNRAAAGLYDSCGFEPRGESTVWSRSAGRR